MEFLRNVSAVMSLVSVLLLVYGFYQVCRTIAMTPGIIAPVGFDSPSIPGWKIPLILVWDAIVIVYDLILIATYGPALMSMILFLVDCYITFLGMQYGASLLGVTVGGGISAILGIIASLVLRNMGKIMHNPNAKVTGVNKWLEGKTT